LYKLAALSNLGRESEALSVLNELLKSRNQFLIQRYAPSILRKIEDQKLTSIASALNFELSNIDRPIITRKIIESSTGVTRNRNLPLEVKIMYDHLCQVCRVPLNTPFGLLSEAAHIQGLGHPHYGSDDISNLLCLCPNHHKSFDNSGWYLNDEIQVVESLTKTIVSDLFVVESHQLSLSAISYQRNYAINASSKGLRIWS
jgi:predicted restriction endonuclease